MGSVLLALLAEHLLFLRELHFAHQLCDTNQVIGQVFKGFPGAAPEFQKPIAGNHFPAHDAKNPPFPPIYHH
jgi:hypothetical protein